MLRQFLYCGLQGAGGVATTLAKPARDGANSAIRGAWMHNFGGIDSKIQTMRATGDFGQSCNPKEVARTWRKGTVMR